MRSRKEKPIFRGLTIAVAGDLGGQWTDINIARWVGLREGRFTRAMDESVTHLVCSNEEFRRRSSMGEFLFFLCFFPSCIGLDAWCLLYLAPSRGLMPGRVREVFRRKLPQDPDCTAWK